MVPILSQGVFISPVNINGTVQVEFVEFEQPLDFDVHDESMFQTSDPRFEFPLTEADVTWINSLFTLPEKLEIRTRKEYRLLTDNEREDFHRAINMLKNDTVGTERGNDLIKQCIISDTVNVHILQTLLKLKPKMDMNVKLRY